MSSGYEFSTNDGSVIEPGALDRSITVNFPFPAGYAQPLFSNLEYQYSRRNKDSALDVTVSANASCALLASATSAHSDGGGIFLGGNTEAQRSVARFDLPDAATAVGADYVDVTIFDPANPEVSVTREIQLVNDFGKNNILNRSTPTSGIGEIAGGTPGDREVLALFTLFGFNFEEYGPEIIGSHISGRNPSNGVRFAAQILGSYYYDDASNTISQLRGSAASLGVVAGVVGSGGVSIGDILTGINTENGTGSSGYTFLLPAIEGFVSMTGFVPLILVLGDGATSDNASAPTALENADAVWDEVRTGHTAVGSFGEYTNANLTNIGGSVNVDSIPITTMFENIISALQGNIVRAGNTYTHKKQDGTTTTFSYTLSGSGRV